MGFIQTIIDAIAQGIMDFTELLLRTGINLVNQILPLDFMTSPGRIAELNAELYVTLNMMVVASFFSLLFGLIFGVIITVTKPKGIMENKFIYFIVDKFVNFFRSIPFVILIPVLIVVARFIVGSMLGVEGMYVPLVFGTVPFFARQIESALSEVDPGLIEASEAMGSSPLEIIFRVYLKESVPGIVRGTTITLVSLLGLTAMAGQVGGGGLGNFAIRYGYQRNFPDATWTTVVVILVLVTLIQGIGNLIIKKTTH